MAKTVKVDDLVIGAGMPKVAVPVVALNAAEAAEQGEKIMHTPADILELRADYIEGYENTDNVLEVLSALKAAVPNRPILFTLRNIAEGGLADLTAGQYLDVCTAVIKSGMISMIDVEFSWGPELTDAMLRIAKEYGIVTIISRHDFEGTPSSEKIVSHMIRMSTAGWDIVKMAVMPKKDIHTIEVMRASAELRDILDIPFILISMSGMGMISRLSCEQFGSAVTFAQAGIASAPGQIDADDLDKVLRIIHRRFVNEARIQEFERVTPITGGNIALCGFMGTGKSTVSRKLNKLTGRPIMEIDDMLVEEAGMSIPEIFKNYGEKYFRDLEERVCAKAAAVDGAIISTGGGTVCRQANVDKLKEAGMIILLEGSPDTVFDRVHKSSTERPMLSRYMSRGYISWLMKQREEIYREAADVIISIDGKNSEEVAKEIYAMITK